jgi:hypothetical protein
MTARECDKCGKFIEPSDEIVVIFRMDCDMLERGDKETRDELYIYHASCFDEPACKVCQFQDDVKSFELHELEQIRDLATSEIDLRNGTGRYLYRAAKKLLPGGDCHA